MLRRESPLDAARIVQALAQHGVDCVLIGGLAVQAHGHVRTTQGADVLPEPGEGNLMRLADALRALNARPAGSRASAIAAELDLEALRDGTPLALDTDAGGVDIHPSPPGGGRYADIRRRALVLTVVGVEVAFAGLDDLIAMKRAARRPATWATSRRSRNASTASGATANVCRHLPGGGLKSSEGFGLYVGPNPSVVNLSPGRALATCRSRS